MLHLGFVFAIQLLLMSSVYVIYFHSNVVGNLEPQKTLMKHAPTNRLVIFYMDGLSSKYFFENHCSNVADLSKIFLHQGQVGIIRNPESSNCRSTQVALFSGFYEKPFTNWIWNDVMSDSLFNRATLSYAWGSDKLWKYHSVNKVNIPYDIISSTTMDSYKLDEWVLNAVEKFLDKESNQLRNLTGLVLVLHLPGLKEACGQQMYRENINYTQRGIWNTYNRVEHTFPDQRTTYLLISDHGMTNKVYFDDKCREEMETPFFLWGAGVSNTNITPGRRFVANKNMEHLPLNILEPIQLAPLSSALLGLPPPVNNRGQLPLEMLNVSDYYGSHIALTNALQLVELAKNRVKQHGSGLFSGYMSNHWMNLQQLNQFVYSGNLLWQQKRFVTLKEYSSNIMFIMLQCIEYYDNYYLRGLLVATSISFLGWQHYLKSQLNWNIQTKSVSRPQLLMVHLIILMVIIFLLLQRVPWIISGFLLLPGCIWKLALIAHEKSAKLSSWIPYLLSLCCLTGFSDRRFIAIYYLGFALYHNRRVILQRSLNSYAWIIVVCVVTSLSWLPASLGCHHRGWFIVSTIFTLIHPTSALGLYRPIRRHMICKGFIMLMAIIHVWFSERPYLLHLIARSFLTCVFYPRLERHGIDLAIYNLSTLYSLICTSYEALVIQALTSEIRLALKLKNENGNCIIKKQTLSMYMLIYSFYSFFILGNVADVDKFILLMGLPGFGLYSTFINALIITLKVCIPMLLMLCIICSKCDTAYANRRKIFYNLLAICNGMAVICLFRVHNESTLRNIGVKIIPFITVQILPFILLLLINLANYLVGNIKKYSLGIS